MFFILLKKLFYLWAYEKLFFTHIAPKKYSLELLNFKLIHKNIMHIEKLFIIDLQNVVTIHIQIRNY